MEILPWLRSNGNKILPIHHLFLRRAGDSCKWKSEGWRDFVQVAVFVPSRQRGLVSMGRNPHRFVLPHGPAQVQSLLISCSNYSVNHSNAFRFKNRNTLLGEETNRKTKSPVKIQTPSPLAQIFFSGKVMSCLTPSH